jgi:hypothetical protein
METRWIGKCRLPTQITSSFTFSCIYTEEIAVELFLNMPPAYHSQIHFKPSIPPFWGQVCSILHGIALHVFCIEATAVWINIINVSEEKFTAWAYLELVVVIRIWRRSWHKELDCVLIVKWWIAAFQGRDYISVDVGIVYIEMFIVVASCYNGLDGSLRRTILIINEVVNATDISLTIVWCGGIEKFATLRNLECVLLNSQAHKQHHNTSSKHLLYKPYGDCIRN